MTSQHSEGVAFEHKIEPVPSSDKMALDLEINGNSNRDEIHHDAPSEFTINKVAPPLSDGSILESVAVNGNANFSAFSSNQKVVPTTVILATESDATDLSPSSLPASSQPLDSNTTNTDLNSSNSLEVQPPTADSIIEAAVDDITASTSVPPVVEAQESDLRHTTTAVAAKPTTDQELDQALDLDLDIPHSTDAPQTDDLSFRIESDVTPLVGTLDGGSASVEGESVHFEIDGVVIPSETAPLSADHSTTLPEPSVLQESVDDMDTDSLPHDQSNTHSFSNMALEQYDTEMADVSEPSTKIAREREDDDEMEPSAKRTKTETDDGEVSATAQDNETSDVNAETQAITPYQVKEFIKILKNVARTNAGKGFSEPVAKLWPAIAQQYTERISNPIDLQTIETKLKSSTYSTMEEFKADVQLIYGNSVTFNGEIHTVTTTARGVRDTILSKTANIPPEPAAPPPKEKKAKRSTPSEESAPRAAAPRRMSRGAHPTPAAPPAPTFALDPTTSTPLIRRDSTKGDSGRPKREIHPPKNKDLPYTVRPKSKKFMTELKFCEDVLNELQRSKHQLINRPFLVPVDPVALGIPNYFAIIKKPMDLSTVSKKLKEGNYSTAVEFEKDVRQIFINCFKFNPPGNPVRKMGQDMEALFNSEWDRKDQWIAEHSPSAATPASDGDSDDQDEEEEDEVSEQHSAIALSALKERLLVEQKKLIDIMSNKTSDPVMLEMQQDMVGLIQKRIDDETSKKKKPIKKPKAQKVPKKAAPVKKSGPTKKAGGNRQSNRYLGTLEKETISTGLGLLPEKIMENVVELIKKEKPELENDADGTMEMDIDAISVPLLWKIHGLIMEYNPDVEANLREQMRGEQESPHAVAKPAAKKKNKPMSKYEQERKIQSLTQKVEQFDRHGSNSQEPVMPTVERQEDSSSGDESASEEE